MTTIRTSFGYELRMQLRKPSLWITIGVLAALMAVISRSNLADILADSDSRRAMVLGGQLVMALLPAGFGCLVADRLVRDDHLHVRQLLDATPAGRGARLVGKYLGVTAATAAPIIAVYLVLAVVYAAYRGDPSALGWASAVIGVAVLPGLLFVAGFALLCPLLMPAPLFRVLFVGYWFWANLINPRMMPTLNGTLLCPTNGYPIQVILGYQGEANTIGYTGPVPGALLNELRPAASVLAAWSSIAVLVAAGAAALVAARALQARAAG
jgi:ABC-2 type transport system permease protein